MYASLNSLKARAGNLPYLYHQIPISNGGPGTGFQIGTDNSNSNSTDDNDNEAAEELLSSGTGSGRYLRDLRDSDDDFPSRSRSGSHISNQGQGTRAKPPTTTTTTTPTCCPKLSLFDTMKVIFGTLLLSSVAFWMMTNVKKSNACNLKLPQWALSQNASLFSLSPSTDFDSTYSDSESGESLLIKKAELHRLLSKARTKMMSVALKYIIDFLIRNGSLRFSCPPNSINGSFPHPLDCQNYYVCDQEGSFREESCPQNKAFDGESRSCVPRSDVELCNQIYTLSPSQHNCTSVGLSSFYGECSKFILCTEEMIPYVASCNKGDFFDPKLKMCLPSTDTEC